MCVFVCAYSFFFCWILDLIRAPIKLKISGVIEYTHISILWKKNHIDAFQDKSVCKKNIPKTCITCRRNNLCSIFLLREVNVFSGVLNLPSVIILFFFLFFHFFFQFSMFVMFDYAERHALYPGVIKMKG